MHGHSRWRWAHKSILHFLHGWWACGSWCFLRRMGFIVYVLAKQLDLPRLAPMAAALLLWTFPYTTLAGKFNANSQLLSLWPWAAALLVMSWRSQGVRGIAVSVGLGVVAAACMLSKYYSGVFLAGFLIPTFLSAKGRQWLLTSRPYVALLAFAAALLPHIAWIAHHDWVTLGYAMEQGDGHVVWRYVLRFALAPLFYWLPAWLAVCGVYGWVQSRMSRSAAEGSNQRWLSLMARNLLVSWRWQGPADVLFWLACMPWMLTLLCGVAGIAELSTPWAIPIGYAFVLLWLRNLDVQTPHATDAVLTRLERAWWPSLVVVALLGVAVGVNHALKSETNYYRPSKEAAQAIVQSWQRRNPQAPLQWVGGAWAENAIVGFYAEPSVSGLRTVPGLPDGSLAKVLPALDWQHTPGLLLCPRGPVTGVSGATKESSACEEEARTWLQAHGQSTQPHVLTVQRSGWQFPNEKAFTYAVYDVLPRTGL
jgi:hypothetical protein